MWCVYMFNWVCLIYNVTDYNSLFDKNQLNRHYNNTNDDQYYNNTIIVLICIV